MFDETSPAPEEKQDDLENLPPEKRPRKRPEMPTTTKREIVERIARKLGYTHRTTREIVQMFLDEVVKELQRGHKLEFRDFGVFRVAKRKTRVARNPRTGEKVELPDRKVVTFKMGRRMRHLIMNEIPPEEDDD